MTTSFDFSIDEMQLDKEWNGQAERFFRMASKLANAKQEYEELENAFKVTKAELELDIRSDPQKYGLDKTTEATVAATVLVQRQYSEAATQVREARHAVDILSAAVEAMQHRKRALENLVSLHLANYYAVPQTTAGNHEELDEMTRTRVRRKAGTRRRGDSNGST